MIVCTSTRVLLPDLDDLRPATVVIDSSTGLITEIHPSQVSRSAYSDDVQWLDFGDKVILPGLVDAHVHLNEPGRTEWEGFLTGTLAAASGGVTTVVDMPLNSIPPTVSVGALEEKRAAAEGQCYVDVAFWGGVIPGNEKHLRPLVEAGVKGFKCFLIESGVDEFPCVSETDVDTSMGELQASSTVLLFHAELPTSSIPDNPSGVTSSASRTRYSTFLDSRPSDMEYDAIAMIIKLQKRYPQLRCHIVHLSAASALPLIREAKASGLKLTVETCFHYLCLAAEDIPAGHPEYKCCPPIRDSSNRDLLWEALKRGTIDCVVSDHSPCVAELKKLDDGDVMGAWGGISTLGLGLSLLWTEGKKRGVSLSQIIRWTSVKSAEHAGLQARKGQLKVGFDGDFVVWNPDAIYEVTKESLKFRNKFSPYEGQTLQGQVEKTYLRGSLIYDLKQTNQGLKPKGKLL